MTGDWRKLHSEELRGLSCWPNTISIIKCRRMRLVGNAALIWQRNGAYKVLVPKPERQKHRRRWEDNIKMNIEEILCKGVNWIHKAHDTDK
jgi:hypothetical protein